MSDFRPHSTGSNTAIQIILSAAIIATATVLSGCATTGQIKQDTVASKVDPYEHINRKIYNFNDSLDSYIAEPVANAYKFITPQFMQTGVFNFFNNLKNINVVINDALQAKFGQAAQDTGRLALNTTLGLGGLFDVAKHVGFEQNDEDFEQTLAVWGVPQGSYLVLPFIGPSTARGVPGYVFDTATNPSTYVGWPVQLVSALNTRASAEGALKFIDEAALDPYVFTRESFLQWRSSLANDGKTETLTDVDKWDEELSSDTNNTPTAASPKAPVENINKESQKTKVSDSGPGKTETPKIKAKTTEARNFK